MLSNEGASGSLDTSQAVLKVKAQMQNSNKQMALKTVSFALGALQLGMLLLFVNLV